MSALPDEIAPLARLDLARRDVGEYLAGLLHDPDELVKVGAWCVLLDRRAVKPGQYAELVRLSEYGAIRSRAFTALEEHFEHGLAAEVAALKPRSEVDAESVAMQATLTCDAEAAAAAARERYLATGRFDALLDLNEATERAGGWRAALAVGVEMLVVYPHEPIAANLVLGLLYNARQTALLESVLKLLERNQLHPYLAAAYRAGLALLNGDAKGSLAAIARMQAARPTRPDAVERVRPRVAQIMAEATEKLGDYKRAYTLYLDLNKIQQGSQPISLEKLPKVTLESVARAVPVLPPDPRTNHFVMTGFPRSGTTLLENALAAHPDIETFEEIPSRESVEAYLATVPERQRDAAVYLRARERYYDEVIRRSQKPGARVFIDKLPMRAIEAGFLVKLFPDKRYIFSIRHPFDVVLSCFKQFFGRNMAMEHFRTFDGAARLYDFTMSQWFGVFTLDDPRIHYLRYDDLVTEFEQSMRATLEFLGVPWDDAVFGFAEAAEARAVKTPSYQKVRQGLSLGIQTQWRNYGFLFQSDAAKPLYKWAEFLGYPTA